MAKALGNAILETDTKKEPAGKTGPAVERVRSGAFDYKERGDPAQRTLSDQGDMGGGV